MNIRSLYIALLALIVLFLFKDAFHLFSPATGVAIVVIVAFIAGYFFLVKFKMPAIKRAKLDADIAKSNKKEIRELVANKTANDEIR
ncbi:MULTISPECIES: hypothetical protein [Pseudomonas]|uniref:hypothetical protein n=1 Tax=Pseudomonas TaxID=286 RepID=UPI0015E280A4|nr:MULTISPECIES: hypothetical protein [Pseudomonas]MBA1220046.1 hypothetical protein [Pseudomonas fulva]MBR7522422.1 hypothetical protein [Pseudomonas juntendi]HDS0926254.1 hypothetical protein [Pseudomonas putida]